MSKSNYLEQQFINGVFGGVAPDTYSDLYISLHTAEPAENGNQQSSEADYAGYSRAAVDVPTGWNRTTSDASNAAALTFPECTGGSNIITHFAVGTDATGAGELLYIGQLDSSITVSTGITPAFAAGNLTISED